ncbi:MAG: YqiA/YcfP family alpha/beta fold hydrolase [Sulfurimonas sp.]
MIIYIHGFGGSAEGSKAKAFREYFKSIDESFIAPSLSYVPDLAMRTLEDLIESYGSNVKLIGSSLGGYYAIYLAQKYSVQAVLLNPSIFPYKTLKGSLGMAPNFYDGSSFEWNEKHLDMLKNYETNQIDKHKLMLFTQTGDELLNYKEGVEKLSGCRMIVEEGGSHGFDGIEKHFETVNEFFCSEL